MRKCEIGETRRFAYRERPKHQAINDAEDRRVRADAEGQHENHHERETGILDQHASAEADVLTKRFKGSKGPHLPSTFLERGRVAEVASGGMPGFGYI